MTALGQGKREKEKGKRPDPGAVARPVLLLFSFSFFLLHFAFYAFSQSAAPSASVREAIYFGPAGPVRIRIHVSIDGRPADAVWSAAIDALFAFRDRNGDGSLDQAERSAFAPPARRGREVDIAFTGGPGVQPLRLAFNQKDEKLSKAAFAEAMRSAGQASVGLRVLPARPDSRDLSAALFKHLDTNGDGRLSPDELRAARDRLAVLDANEDELLSAAELLGPVDLFQPPLARRVPRLLVLQLFHRGMAIHLAAHPGFPPSSPASRQPPRPCILLKSLPISSPRKTRM